MSELTIQEMRTYCEAVIHAARTGQVKFKLTIEEPSETDIQADILQALGRQDRVLVDRKGQKVWVLDGLYKRPGGVFWRANCGGGMANGRVIRGNPNGTADILGVINGRPVAIEVKTRTGKQSDIQRSWQTSWEAAGGIYIVARSVQEVVEWFKEAT